VHGKGPLSLPSAPPAPTPARRARSRAKVLARLSIVVSSVLAVVVLLAIRSRRVEPLPPPPPPPPPPPTAWPTPFSVEIKALPPRAALPPGTTRILVLGDSVASFLGLALRYRQDEASAFVAARGVGQCSIFEAKVRVVNGERILGTSCSATWTSDVTELGPDVTLLVLGGAFLGDQACDAPFLTAYERRVLALIEAMGERAGRVVITRVPYPMERWRHGNVLDRVDCFNDMLRRTSAKARVPMLDLMGYVCPTRACIAESQGQPVRPDGLHFDGKGAEETARWVLRELRRVAASEGH